MAAPSSRGENHGGGGGGKYARPPLSLYFLCLFTQFESLSRTPYILWGPPEWSEAGSLLGKWGCLQWPFPRDFASLCLLLGREGKCPSPARAAGDCPLLPPATDLGKAKARGGNRFPKAVRGGALLPPAVPSPAFGTVLVVPKGSLGLRGLQL